MPSLSDKNQANVIEVLKIYNSYFEQMVSQIYPAELQFNKANSSDTEAFFWTWTSPLPMAEFHLK